MRKVFLENYINSTIKNGFNEFGWWQLRATYSPGYFTYNPDSLSPYSILRIKDNLTSSGELFTYHSKHLQSTDYLTKGASLDNDNYHDRNVLFKDSQSIIERDNNGTVYLRRLIPAKQLPEYNGLIDYEVLNIPLTDKYWETTSVLK